MKKVIVAALGATLTITALGGRMAGPYTLVAPPGQNRAATATAQCQERLADAAVVLLTHTRDDGGGVDVVYRCER
jgi:hypothetical protein